MQITAAQIDVLLERILRAWPRLRATATVPDDDKANAGNTAGGATEQANAASQHRDLTLIPQALQAEEDLLFFLREYKTFKNPKRV